MATLRCFEVFDTVCDQICARTASGFLLQLPAFVSSCFKTRERLFSVNWCHRCFPVVSVAKKQVTDAQRTCHIRPLCPQVALGHDGSLKRGFLQLEKKNHITSIIIKKAR